VKKLKPKEEAYWRRYLDSLPRERRPSDPFVEANYCGNREITDELLGLYLSGKKTAGSGLVKDYETAGDPLPREGNYWILLDGQDNPRCIVRTTRVEIHRYRDVPAEVAAAEGEGDRSLASWKRAHAAFFAPFLSGWGIADLEEAEVVTEFFEVVYR
jgi:5-formyltetrahydrofolate cyclo-ligase